jgi:WD40 repeat protein
VFTAALLAFALAADPKPRPDPDGEPLPKEAVQRFGSLRFLVNSFSGAVFSPDGKTVYTVSGEDSSDCRQPYTSPGLVAWEVPSGKKLWQAGVDRRLEQVMADPDGKSVWVLERVKRTIDEDPDQFQRVRFSAVDGKELARTTPVEGYITPALHPTGVLADFERVLDREGKSTDLPKLDLAEDAGIAAAFWSPKGDQVYLITTKSGWAEPCLTALDRSTGKQIWSLSTEPLGGWGVMPDGKSVVIVTQKGKGEKVTVHARRLDAKTGKELGAIEVPNVYCVDELMGPLMNDFGVIHIHPDGKTVYLIDKEHHTLAIDVATWNTVPTKVKLAAHAVFSPDGKTLLAPVGRHLAVYETDTGKRLGPNEPGFEYPEHNTWFHFSAGSDRLIRRGHLTDETVIEWDLLTGRQTRRIETRGDRSEQVTLSADGTKKAVVKKVGEEWQGTITKVNTPKDPPVLLNAGWKDGGWPYWSLTFTPDAAHLVGYHPDHGLHIWDTKRGGKPVEVTFQQADRGWIKGEGVLVSPSGREVAAVAGGHPVAKFVPPADKWTWQLGVYEIPSGKLVHRFEGKGDLDKYRWIDDRIAALVNFPAIGSPFGPKFDTAGGKSQLVCMDPALKSHRATPIDVSVRAWAAAPFGDTVAVGSSDGLRLYEASTGKLRYTFGEQKRPVEVLAFSPNGRHLAAESVDGPILLWDVRGDLTKPAKPDAAGWERAWAALGEVDAPAAFQAVRFFALHPEEGAAELKRRFAEKPPTVEEIVGVVGKLDDRTFAVRQEAERQLRAMGTVAFPALKKALEANPSEEFKERAGRLLAVQIPADRLQAERAVEVLRLADTEGTRKLLAEWAAGDAKRPLTVAAKRK